MDAVIEAANTGKRAPLKLKLVRHLDVFRPSDRGLLEQALSTPSGREAFLGALKLYVQGWERSSWLEEYRVERMGKWIAAAAPRSLTKRVQDWCEEVPSAARKALTTGINIGLELSTSQKSLILRKTH